MISTMTQSLRGPAAVVAMVLIAACSETMVDEFPPVAFATLSGTVTHPDGAVYASGGMWAACGHESPSEFGFQGRTDARGQYRLELEAPDVPPSQRADTFPMRCRASAPNTAQPFASETATVLFTRSRANRLTTVLHLGRAAP